MLKWTWQKKLVLSISLVIGVLVSQVNPAFSSTTSGDPQSPAPALLSWEQFKESCLHPEQFHFQVPPSNIRIHCTDVQREYVALSPGQLPLPLKRKIISSVFSNKYNVIQNESISPITSKGGSCQRFKEVEKTLNVERILTCEDVLGIKSDLNDFCTSVLNAAKISNSKLMDVRDTGRVLDTCKPSYAIQD